jgi:hypothetical protein
MDSDVRLPRASGFDLDYWLCRCEGFRVESPTGRRVGLVEELRFRSRLDRPDALAVRTGLLGRRLLLFPVEDVAELVPREERLVLRTAPSSGGSKAGRTR